MLYCKHCKRYENSARGGRHIKVVYTQLISAEEKQKQIPTLWEPDKFREVEIKHGIDS